jgi:hypothetical protein
MNKPGYYRFSGVRRLQDLSCAFSPKTTIWEWIIAVDTCPRYNGGMKRAGDLFKKKGILHSGVIDSLGEAFEKGRKFGYQSNEATIVRIV